jgi:hypothetical protein
MDAVSHDADLDGRCERCGTLIGFHGSHTDDECIDALKAALGVAVTAMRGVLDVCRDRQAFVMLGPRAFGRAENIVMDAFTKLDLPPYGKPND